MAASKFTFEFDITNLVHAKRTKNDKDGNPIKVLIIPIDLNHLELNYKKDGYIIRGTMNPVSEQKENGRTHYMRLSVPKGIYENMSEEERKAIPYLGSAKEWPEETRQSTPPPNQGFGDFNEPEEDDLPF